MSYGEKRTNILSQQTLVPISLVITLITFAYWVSSVAAIASQTKTDLDYMREQRQQFEIRLTEKLDTQIQNMSELKASVSAIDAKVTMLRETQMREIKKEIGP